MPKGGCAAKGGKGGRTDCPIGSRLGAGAAAEHPAHHREAEEALQKERDLLNGIIEGSSDLIAALDVDFRYLAFNRAYQAEFKRLFGCDIRIGARLAGCLCRTSADRQCAMEMWERALGGEEFTVTHELGDPGRARRHYEMRFSSIRDHESRLIGAAHIVRDVTDRRRMEDRLQKTQFAVDEAAEPVFWVNSQRASSTSTTRRAGRWATAARSCCD